jgi:hypothetical protein
MTGSNSSESTVVEQLEELQDEMRLRHVEFAAIVRSGSPASPSSSGRIRHGS